MYTIQHHKSGLKNWEKSWVAKQWDKCGIDSYNIAYSFNSKKNTKDSFHSQKDKISTKDSSCQNGSIALLAEKPILQIFAHGISGIHSLLIAGSAKLFTLEGLNDHEKWF